MVDKMAGVLFQAALGKIDVTTVEAFNTAYKCNSVLRSNCPVTDIDGNPLEKDKIYETPNGKIRITSWEFGSGNLMDTYYRVFFIGEDLKNGMKVIDAKHQKDLSRTYPTNWKLVV